jgi:hypothetical protein
MQSDSQADASAEMKNQPIAQSGDPGDHSE